MLSRFKTKISSLKNDIDKKFDHLEVDSKRIRNKLKRNVDAEIAHSGVHYVYKRDEKLIEIENANKKNEQNVLDVIELIKEAEFGASKFLFSIQNFEKEFYSLNSSIQSVKDNLDRVLDLCLQVNDELNTIENECKEKANQEQIDELYAKFENYCAMKSREAQIKQRIKKTSSLAQITSNEGEHEDLEYLANENENIELKASGLQLSIIDS